MPLRGIIATKYVVVENMRERHEGWQMRSDGYSKRCFLHGPHHCVPLLGT